MMKLQRQVSGNIRRDSNCLGDICPCNICLYDICLICGCGSAHFIDLQSQVCAIYKWENCLVELSFIDGAACQLTHFGLFIQGLIIRHRQDPYWLFVTTNTHYLFSMSRYLELACWSHGIDCREPQLSVHFACSFVSLYGNVWP